MATPPQPGNPRKLPTPPKFGGDASGTAWPNSLSEAISFTRWLVSLWRVASESINNAEALAFAKVPGRQGSDQETLSASQALNTPRPSPIADLAAALGLGTTPRPRPPADPTEAVIFQRVSGRAIPDELTALTASGQVRWPAPPRGGAILVGTHAERLALPAPSYPQFGFWETDRTVFYVSNGTVWRYVAGVMRAAVASEPGDLVAGDVGFAFYATDLGRGVYWDGAAYVEAPKSIRIALDSDRVNVAANEAMLTGGGAANSLSICFGDDTTNFATVFGTPVAGVFKARLAVLAAGGLIGYQGAGPTATWQIGANGAVFPQNTAAGLYAGAGSPNGVVSASKGSMYLQTNATNGTVAIWDKETGSGNTGWELMVSGSSIIDADHGGTGHAGGYTKGDLLAASDPDTLDQVGVGTDGDVLTADSGAAAGVSWQAPASGEANNYLEDHSGGITLNTGYQATGIAVTLDQDGYWMILGTADAFVNSAGGLLEVALEVNAVPQTGVATLFTSNVSDTVRASITRTWIYHNTGGVTPVAELYGRVASTGGGGTGTVFGTNSTIVAVFLHS